MAVRHPLPYAYARANNLLLEDDGARMVLWAPETVSLPALSELLRLYEVDTLEREAAATLGSRISAAYAGGESSAAMVIGEVESAVDLTRMMQDLPAVERTTQPLAVPPSSPGAASPRDQATTPVPAPAPEPAPEPAPAWTPPPPIPGVLLPD